MNEFKKFDEKLYNRSGSLNLRTVKKIADYSGLKYTDGDFESEPDGWGGKETYYASVCLESLKGMNADEGDAKILYNYFKSISDAKILYNYFKSEIDS